MPASNLLSPHPSERWRSVGGAAYLLLDLGVLSDADTFFVKGLIASAAATVRLRLSSADSTGAAGDVFDSGSVANGSANLDVDYFAACWCLDGLDPWRYARLDIVDATRSFIEVGSVCAGQREAFAENFQPGGGIQFVDRSRVAPTATGLSLVSPDNWFRRIDLTFEMITQSQRWGMIERLDRVNGRRRNTLLITDTASSNLARDSFFGLVKDISPSTWAQAIEIYGKQISIEERL